MTKLQFIDYLSDVVSGHVNLTLPIVNEIGGIAGEMRPITLDHLDSIDILQKLTEWRNQNRARFLTEFEATPQRTRNWLANTVLKTPGQMLFLIYECDQLVGHLGFKGLTANEGVLDNAIKGEQTAEAKLFVYAHNTLSQWLFDSAKIKTLYGYVLSDNVAAIMMNRLIGWTGWIRHPLFREEEGGDIVWRIGPAGETSQYNKYCYEITLNNAVKKNA